jgi:hypothetical protein
VVNGDSRRGHAPWCRLGSARSFEFGKPTWVHKASTKKAMIDQIRRFLDDHRSVSSNEPYHNKRPVIFLFFDSRNDTKWLGEMDINLSREFPNSKIVDCQQQRLCKLIGQRLATL